MSFNGYDVDIVGDCYELILLTSCGREGSEHVLEEALKLVGANEGTSVSAKEESGLVNIKTRAEHTEEFLEQLRNVEGVSEVKEIHPILTVLSNRHADIPFASAEEMLAYGDETGKELWELGVEYEMARSGWSRQRVMEYMEYVVDTMENSAIEGLKGEGDMSGIISPTSGKVEAYIKQQPSALDMGVLNTVVPWSMAVMEYSSTMGKVLCAPTGGSAGVFPGAVLGTANHMGLEKDAKVRAMFVTAVIGIVMSKDCNYSAELYGCQVEPGLPPEWRQRVWFA